MQFLRMESLTIRRLTNSQNDFFQIFPVNPLKGRTDPKEQTIP